jgi:hypothetical protein
VDAVISPGKSMSWNTSAAAKKKNVLALTELPAEEAFARIIAKPQTRLGAPGRPAPAKTTKTTKRK